MLRSASPLPEAVLDEERANSNVEWLAGKLGAYLAGVAGNHIMEGFSMAAFRYRSWDEIENVVRHTVRFVHTPTDDDRKSIRPPKALAPFLQAREYWETNTGARTGLAPGPPLASHRPRLRALNFLRSISSKPVLVR
jgi:hypothetical protein